MRKLMAYLMVLLAVSACRMGWEDDFSGGMDPSLEGKPVTFTFSVPDVRVAFSTKGVDGDDGPLNGDPYLDPEKLYLIVCGGNQSIKYIRKAEIVGSDQVPVTSIVDYPLKEGVSEVTMYKFRVQLELTDSPRTVHFLGNIDENRLNTGSAAYEILPSLMSYEGKQAYWQKINMPPVHPRKDNNGELMTDESGAYLPSLEAENALKHVPLIRNYAKISVTDATAEEDGFQLYSYAVIHFPKRGTVAPYRNNINSDSLAFIFTKRKDYRLSGYEKCNFDSLSVDLDYLGYLSPNVEFDHNIPDSSLFAHPENSGGRVIRYNPNNTEQGFYLYERCIPDDNLEPTFVIIRGKFGEGNEYYYYRLDLMETKTVEYESVYQYYPIYRNFRYDIQLNRISSIGVSTPEAAANSSGAEDISADISMKHLSDISNGQTRLVVEPFMSKTYTGPNEEGYYYIYARFFNDVNSAEANEDWGAVSVELEPMSDGSDDILILYDDVGNAVHGFYPESQTMGGEPGFRVIRFNTKAPGTETKTQKIMISGRNLYAHEEYPLYREVEITLQKKQSMAVTLSNEQMPLQKGAKQQVLVTIPAGLPESMFPLEFTIEAELPTLTPDNEMEGNNLPVYSGISISDNPKYAGKNTIQFIRTLTRDEYNGLQVQDGLCTFTSFFKSNRSDSKTTIWVGNEYFIKGSASFTNLAGLKGHFFIRAEDENGCNVVFNNGNNMEYNYDETGWKAYKAGTVIKVERGYEVAFRSTTTIKAWNGGNKIYCYAPTSNKDERDGCFSVGGNIASLIVGDDFVSGGASVTGWSFLDFFKGHKHMIDASELILPMLKCEENCYKSMFDSCTDLVHGPSELPATTMAKTCYRNMFYNCSSLVEAPYIATETTTADCFQRMFAGCSSLRLIKLNAREYKAKAYQADKEVNWVNGVNPEGEIWINPAITGTANWEKIIPRDVSAGWEWQIKTLPNGDPWSY